MRRLWANGGLTPLVVILLLSPFLVQHIAASVSFRQVTWLNYGVIFTALRTVKLVSDTWSHVFDLHLPHFATSNPRFQLPHCNNATSNAEQARLRRTCERNREVVYKLHQQHVDMVQYIRTALQHVYHLLPTEKNISTTRSRKRSLLPIGGVLLSELFGTTSEADLHPIKEHIRRLAKGISRLDQGLQM